MQTAQNQQISGLQIFSEPVTSKHPYDVAIGKKIEARRLQLRWTQSDLGEKLYLGQGRISEIENGVYGLRLRELPRWAEVLDCRVADIIV